MANQADFNVRTLCRVLEVSPSGFCDLARPRTREESARQ